MSREHEERSQAKAPADSASAWFERWFGETYLELYPHRDEREAAAAVELLIDQVSPSREMKVLDLACGAGRHVLALRNHGIRALGLDLSLALLRRARESDGSLPLVRGDMRLLPFRSDSFDLVTSFFTSFGYFSTPQEDQRVLVEIGRVLNHGGSFLLDFMNARRVRETLSPRDSRTVGGREVIQERRIVEPEGIVEKLIHIRDPESGDTRTFRERVRLYDRDDLAALLTENGFVVKATFGDYEGNPFLDTSPRMIFLAHRA